MNFATRLCAMVLALFVFSAWGQTQPDTSCHCPTTECGPCMEEQGLTFYSQKCGLNLDKVKSCARPTCVPMENPPLECAKAAAAKPATPTAPTAAEPAKTQPQAPVASERGASIGTVKAIRGTAWLRFPDGTKEVLNVGASIHEKDTVLTDKGGGVQIEFADTN